MDLPGQLVHTRRVRECTRRIGMRILGKLAAFERVEAGDLVFLPAVLANARSPTGPGNAGLDPATIECHDHARSNRLARLGPAMVNVVLDLEVPPNRQLRTDLLGQPTYMLSTGGDVGLSLEYATGGRERLQLPAGFDDLAKGAGAIRVAGQSRSRSRGEKSRRQAGQ
jgi:hypothetical protein